MTDGTRISLDHLNAAGRAEFARRWPAFRACAVGRRRRPWQGPLRDGCGPARGDDGRAQRAARSADGVRARPSGTRRQGRARRNDDRRVELRTGQPRPRQAERRRVRKIRKAERRLSQEIRFSVHHLRAPAHPRFDPAPVRAAARIAAETRVRRGARPRSATSRGCGWSTRSTAPARRRPPDGCRPTCSTRIHGRPAPGVAVALYEIGASARGLRSRAEPPTPTAAPMRR